MNVVGVFRDPRAAERALEELCDAGIDRARVRLSRLPTEDGIAAEAPGQSFENQPGQRESESAQAPYAEAFRSGGSALSVSCDSAEDREWLGELLLRCGSSGTWTT